MNEVNDSPSATNDSPTTNEDTPVTFNPLANDTDVDGTLDGSTVILSIRRPVPSVSGRQDADRSWRRRLHRAANRRNHVQPGGEFFRYDNVGDVRSGGQRQRDNFCQYFDFSE
ncbi:MAG: Ig-like domain-containing protein [Pirellulaceae bacterium]